MDGRSTFDSETVTLAAGKLEKLQHQLHELAKKRKIPRKLLERALGLLMWATTTCSQLRPYMAPLYKDLHSGKGTLHSVHANSWQTFLDALDEDAVVRHKPVGMWLPLGAKLPSPSQARALCPKCRRRTNRSGLDCKIPTATSCTCAMKAGPP